MRYKALLYCFSLFFFLPLQGQQTATKNISGQVSFLSSQNIYVRFSNTRGINVHDTLYISSGEKLIPVLVVNSLSSTSCLCSSISNEDLPVGHIIIAKPGPVDTGQDAKTLAEIKAETPVPVIKDEPPAGKSVSDSSGSKAVNYRTKQRITGSISAASYSDFSNTAGADLQRFRYTLSLNAANIANSRLSAETYISFRHTSGKWDEVKSDVFNALKIYSLALKYDIGSTMQLKFGRQINPRTSSIGSFDGLVFEKTIKRVTMGLTGGTRPDYMTYGFNPNLLQYGAYVSYDYSGDVTYSGTSLAFLEQLNSGKTDRRFLYFQHTGSVTRNLSLFSSFELDVFKLINGKAAPAADLTSLYASLNYRVSDNVTLSGSYDARKNPVYYETNRTRLDTLLENGLRQSFRINTYFRISRTFMFGVQSSLRFLKTDLRQTKNISGYLTYSYPGNNYFSATLSGNYIQTSFINGYNGGISLLNGFSKGRVQTGIGYNYQNYSLPEGHQDIIQHTGKADLYLQASQKTSFSINYEITFETKDIFNRMYIQFRQRF